MPTTNRKRLLDASRRLQLAVLQTLKQVNTILAMVNHLPTSLLPAHHVTEDEAIGELRIVREMFSVQWAGRTCHLGNRFAFRLLDVLAGRPNEYLSVDYLRATVWAGDHRQRSSVRSAVGDLRHRLRSAGMSELAAAIDGSGRGHYRLQVSGGEESSDRNPTGIRQRPKR